MIIDSNQTLNGVKKIIFLVEGKLDVIGNNAKIVRADKKSFLGFIVNKNITFGTSLSSADDMTPVVNGFFLTDNQILIPATSTQFVGKGIFVAFGGFNFARDLGSATNATNPAERFFFDPSLIINAPADLMGSSYYWKEVAP